MSWLQLQLNIRRSAPLCMPKSSSIPTRRTRPRTRLSSGKNMYMSVCGGAERLWILTAHCARAEGAALALDHWNAQSADVHVGRVGDDSGCDSNGELEHEPGLRALAPFATSAGCIADDCGESTLLMLLPRRRRRCIWRSIKNHWAKAKDGTRSLHSLSSPHRPIG